MSAAKHSLLIIITWLTAIYHPCFGQIGAQEKAQLSGDLEKLSAARTGAVCYLQTNKGIYETGEDLWLKAYLLDEKELRPFCGDTTLYLQLLPVTGGKPILQEKLLLTGGFASGHLYIPDTLSDGEYYLQAASAHSYMGQSEFKSLHKIRVTQSIVPEIRSSYTFGKKAYIAGDSITLSLSLKLPGGSFPEKTQIKAALERGGQVKGLQQTYLDPDGSVNLSFAPPDSISASHIRIQAFTKAGNIGAPVVIPVPHRVQQLRFGLFPEGGYLVSGVAGVLAFKATDEQGKPIPVRGTLLEDGKKLRPLATEHYGMGKVAFTPVPGRQYTVALDAPYQDSSYRVRDIKTAGISLAYLGKAARGYAFRIAQPKNQPEAAVYLKLQQRGTLYYAAKGRLRDSLTVVLPGTELAQGIAEVTLLDEAFRPLAERLVYVHPEKKLNIRIDSLRPVIGPRGLQRLRLKVTDEQGKPVIAHLGVSVYDTLYRNIVDTKNILTHYFLDSELRGSVYQPDWYFDERNAQREQALDLLMLTQGWRRYVWTAEQLVSYHEQPVMENSISGSISVYQRKKKLGGAFYTLFFAPNNKQYRSFILPDSSGNFRVSPQDLASSGNGYIYTKVSAPEGTKVNITFDEPFARMASLKNIYPGRYAAPLESSQEPFSITGRAIRLKEVVIKARTSTQFRDKYIGYLDSLNKLDLTSDYIEVRDADSANYRTSNTRFTLNNPLTPQRWRKKPVEGKTYALLYYQGQLITYANHNGSMIFDESRSVVYHYPKFTEKELMQKYNLGRVKGYNIAREFYSPGYADAQALHDPLPDNRNALYWKPDVITDPNGEAMIEFYSSDIRSGFSLVIEGADGSGLLGHYTAGFKVNAK